MSVPPKWIYNAPKINGNGNGNGNGNSSTSSHNQETDSTEIGEPSLDGELAHDLGTYSRDTVTNVGNGKGREYFDLGLRHLLSYQSELAAKCFLACVHFSPYCALAHSLLALCHSPNYNFKGDPYYDSTNHPEEKDAPYHLCLFPSQQVADRHSKLALDKLDEIKKIHKKGKPKGPGKKKKNTVKTSHSDNMDTGRSYTNHNLQKEGDLNNDANKPSLIRDVEAQIITAVRTLTCNPGVSPDLADELVGRPYADAMRKIYKKYPNDAEVCYFFAESLMVLNAWKLYEYPTGKPLSPDVVETRELLESVLEKHSYHGGLCHMYVHLSEMSSEPEKALKYCGPLRNDFPHAGHLKHMSTHIDVLVGDYESCVRWNYEAILADDHCMKSSPSTAGTISFYFGYIVHNYHMLVYGCILGGMEEKAMQVARKLNGYLNEFMFTDYPDLVAYLEAYSALEVHVMVRFGRWEDILLLEPPKDKHLMLFRAATIIFAKGLAYANLGNISLAKKEADRFDSLRKDPNTEMRILHNNNISSLLAVDAPMLRGEIAYHEGNHEKGFEYLRKAVKLQDELNYDEPWGRMQPIRHALGGLLLEQGHLVEAEKVFRIDLKFHPRNPFGLVGLIKCLQKQINSGLLMADHCDECHAEMQDLRNQLVLQRKSQWADFDIQVPCLCCSKE